MATVTSRFGKCSNFGNCSLADARRPVEVRQGADFVCTECGKPLLPVDGGEAAGGRATRGVGVVVAALAIAGGAAWFLLRDKPAAPAPLPPPVVVAPAAPPVVPRPAEPAPRAVPQTGDCSEADQRAGLCTRAP